MGSKCKSNHSSNSQKTMSNFWQDYGMISVFIGVILLIGVCPWILEAFHPTKGVLVAGPARRLIQNGKRTWSQREWRSGLGQSVESRPKRRKTGRRCAGANCQYRALGVNALGDYEVHGIMCDLGNRLFLNELHMVHRTDLENRCRTCQEHFANAAHRAGFRPVRQPRRDANNNEIDDNNY